MLFKKKIYFLFIYFIYLFINYLLKILAENLINGKIKQESKFNIKYIKILYYRILIYTTNIKYIFEKIIRITLNNNIRNNSFFFLIFNY